MISNAIERWKRRIKELKTETYAIYLASKDPRVPWYAKAVIVFVVAHTFSPIDLIPDFIPVLGYLDDLIITPLGIALALKMVPKEKPTNWTAAAIIIVIWLVILALGITTTIRIIETYNTNWGGKP